MVRRVMLVEKSVASAVGAGLDVNAPRGCMAADLGAGTTDVAIMSLKGIAVSVSAKVGGGRYGRGHCPVYPQQI